MEPSGLETELAQPYIKPIKHVASKCGCFLPDEGVDLDGVNVVQLLQSSLDLALVGLHVDDEDQGVVLLNLLHGALGVQRVQNDLLGVQLGLAGDGHAGVLGRPRELEGLRAVEGGRGANLAGLVELFRETDQYLCAGNKPENKTYGRALHNCLGGSVGLGGRAGAYTQRRLVWVSEMWHAF